MTHRAPESLPRPLLAFVWVAALFFALPLAGLLARAPWARLGELLGTPAVGSAVRLSLVTSTCAAALALAFGLPLAAWLAAGRTPLRAVVRVLVVLPMVLPPVVGGVALLLAFGRNGWIGGPVEDLFGVSLPFSTAGVVAAQTYVALPFFVLTAEAGFRSMDARYTQVAATLGASGWRRFRCVTLPLIAPSLRAGCVVAWARALGEFGATITFAGNLPGETQTLPLAVFVALQTEPDAAVVLSLVLVLASAVLLFLSRDHWFRFR